MDPQGPEIDRGQLRDLFLDSLEPGTVNWGYNLSKWEIAGVIVVDVVKYWCRWNTTALVVGSP